MVVKNASEAMDFFLSHSSESVVCESDGISKEVDFKNLLDRSSTGKSSPEGHLVKPLKADDLIRAIKDVID